MQKKVLETGVSLHRGPMGNLGCLLTGNFKRYLEGCGKGAPVFAGALLGGLLSGDPEGYGKEGSGDGHHPVRGLFTGNSER